MSGDEFHTSLESSWSTIQPLYLSSFRQVNLQQKKRTGSALGCWRCWSRSPGWTSRGRTWTGCTSWPRTQSPCPERPSGSPQTPGGFVRFLLLGKVTWIRNRGSTLGGVVEFYRADYISFFNLCCFSFSGSSRGWKRNEATSTTEWWTCCLLWNDDIESCSKMRVELLIRM